MDAEGVYTTLMLGLIAYSCLILWVYAHIQNKRRERWMIKRNLEGEYQKEIVEAREKLHGNQ